MLARLKNRPKRAHSAGQARLAGFRWPAVAIFSVALAVRATHVWQIRGAPYFTVLLGDSKAYDEWALRISRGDWLGHDVFYQAPLYPYFLGTLYATAGRDLLVVRICQAIIGSVACVLLGLAGWRLFSKRAGMIAGLGLALYAPAIFFDALLQKSVLDVFFICLAIWLVSGLGVQPQKRLSWLWLGLALGGLCLTRENAIVFVAVILLWALAPFEILRAPRARRGARARPPSPHRLAAAGAFLLGLTIVLLPVAARNKLVGGEFHLTTSQFGPNFYIGNNERADGTYMSLRFGRGAPQYERQDATELAERATGRPLTPAEVSSYWTGRALAFIRSQPLAWLKLLGRKTALVWNATEMLDTESQATHAEHSLVLRLAGPVTHFGVLVPLALAGVWITWPDRRRLWPLYLMAGAYAASVVMFYVFARYRYPLAPFLVLFASAGLVGATRLVRERRARAIALCAAAAAAAAAFCNWPLLSEDLMRAITANNIGAALQEQGRFEPAAAHYRRAIDVRPDYAPAHNNLGVALRAQGRIDEAIARYEEAIRLHSDYPDAHYNLANALLADGQPDGATRHFRRALELDPHWIEARNNLGIALAARGELDEAARSFRQAIALEPSSAEAHYNLGGALADLGQADEAIREYRRALEARPDYFAARYDLGRLLLERGELSEAATQLARAIELDPKSAEAHNNLGIALASAGRLGEAVDRFEQALRLKPDLADARRNLATARRRRERIP